MTMTMTLMEISQFGVFDVVIGIIDRFGRIGWLIDWNFKCLLTAIL